MLSLGPLPIPGLFALLAAGIAIFVTHRAAPAEPPAQRQRTSQALTNALLLGLIAARLAFVAMWPASYRDDLFAVLRIGDGGLSLVAGCVVAAAYLAWCVRRERFLLRPIAFGAVAGIGLWLAGTGLITLMHRSVPIPTTALETLDGRATALPELAGQPLVVNLWATWCPPCRREMPALAAAQRARPDLTFAFVNQGEGTDQVREYLAEAGLSIENVLLDARSGVMQDTGTRGLPTTLFFDAQGRLVDSHVGELNQATLEHKLQRADPRLTGRAPGTD